MVADEVTMSRVFTKDGFFVFHLQVFVSNMTIIREIVITWLMIMKMEPVGVRDTHILMFM